jgi:alkylhydroperoxidase/carboxymuconolactone decarboxylase family protein YurZ
MQEQNLAARLQRLRDKRNYLLPHHGLLAISTPGLLEAHDDLYTAMALTPRQLSRHDHESVWMAILIATDEALGTHHIAKFRAAGGTDRELATILAFTSLALGCGACQFVERHWQAHLPAFAPREAYLDAFRRAAGDSPLPLAHLAACAVHTCAGNMQALAWQICAAYGDGAAESELAEALSLTMFPGGVPNFVNAAGVWRELILADGVAASADFRSWAAMAGQGGYDEAAGMAGTES